MIEKTLEFFVEYLLIATIMIVALGVGWTVGKEIKKSLTAETREELQQQAVQAGVARYNPVNKNFEWIPPETCNEK
jgi:hypothetical protein